MRKRNFIVGQFQQKLAKLDLFLGFVLPIADYQRVRLAVLHVVVEHVFVCINVLILEGFVIHDEQLVVGASQKQTQRGN